MSTFNGVASVLKLRRPFAGTFASGRSAALSAHCGTVEVFTNQVAALVNAMNFAVVSARHPFARGIPDAYMQRVKATKAPEVHRLTEVPGFSLCQV
jgi:hypothetical protein